jgi:hypothetical protein
MLVTGEREQVRPVRGPVVRGPNIVLGVHVLHRSPQHRPGPHRCERGMGVDQIDLPLLNQRPETAQPACAPPTVQAVNRQAGRPYIPNHRILPWQQVRHLVVEALPIEVGRGADQEHLGASSTQALDQMEDALHDGASSR